MEECDNCHAQPWKYRFNERGRPGIHSLCGSCFADAIRNLSGIVDIRQRRSDTDAATAAQSKPTAARH
jgi:hypothetical protein